MTVKSLICVTIFLIATFDIIAKAKYLPDETTDPGVWSDNKYSLNLIDTIELQEQHQRNGKWLTAVVKEGEQEEEERAVASRHYNMHHQHNNTSAESSDIVDDADDDTDAVAVYDDDEVVKQRIQRESYDKYDDVGADDDFDTPTSGYEIEEVSEELLARKRREVSDWFIAPNTRWCGRGNTANGTYNHLGGASSADKCCRTHDHCKIFIPAMSNRYELFNYRPYTMSHCSCDRRFRTCLKMANDEDAKTIGKLFFNMVQTQCFILKSEKICQVRDDNKACVREIVKHKAYLKNNKKF